jgi:LytS/YehU family sensor histidine kinase
LERHLTPFSIMDCWMALMDIVPIAAIAVVIKFVRIQSRSRDKERSLMKAKLETELKFLRNQTNPHFLFNTLTSIHALACRNSDDTPKVIMTLSKLLNFTLYESMSAMIVVGDELQMLDKYIELESIRYEGKREIDFISEIDNAYEQIAPLLLLSLVQHAFIRADEKNGIEPYIQIDIKLQSGALNVRIETSRGRSDHSMPGDSVGLANMRRRIGLLYSDYNLEIVDSKELFKAELALNLHSHAEI